MQKGTQLRQVTEQEKQVYHAFDSVELNKREFLNEGETEEQYNYHCQEKDFIIDYLQSINKFPKYDVHKIRYDHYN